MRIEDPNVELRCAGPLYKRNATALIIIHHTDMQDDVGIESINEQHINMGWAMIAYNYIIDNKGSIKHGRPEDAVGMHCLGYNNVSIGVAVCGNFDLDEVSEKQKKSLIKLAAMLCKTYKINSKSIVGHRDKNSVSCPGDNLYNIIPSIRKEVDKLNM